MPPKAPTVGAGDPFRAPFWGPFFGAAPENRNRAKSVFGLLFLFVPEKQADCDIVCPPHRNAVVDEKSMTTKRSLYLNWIERCSRFPFASVLCVFSSETLFSELWRRTLNASFMSRAACKRPNVQVQCTMYRHGVSRRCNGFFKGGPLGRPSPCRPPLLPTVRNRKWSSLF